MSNPKKESPMNADLTKIEKTTETREVHGIRLPYSKPEYDEDLNVVGTETGEVFIEMGTLHMVAEQGVWDSQFGPALVIPHLQGLALEQAGLAVKETRGGLHRTEALLDLLKRLREI